MQATMSEPTHETHDRTLLGVTIHDLGRDRAIARIDQALAQRSRLNVCFANAQALNVACGNDRFRSALRRFLVLNDGLGTDIASRIKFGRPFRENLNGTDFVPDFLEKTQYALRIFLVGTTDARVERAAEKLHLAYPRHTIVGWRNGFFLGPQDVEQTCYDIRVSRADCVLVGMGNPLQELWIDKHGDETGACLFFAVGALLDFQAGSVRRAPVWVRNLRCEWTYRLLQEPLRLAQRYLIGNFVFLGRVLADTRR
jgi:alpha-1,3-mannosyltransferase